MTLSLLGRVISSAHHIKSYKVQTRNSRVNPYTCDLESRKVAGSFALRTVLLRGTFK